MTACRGTAGRERGSVYHLVLTGVLLACALTTPLAATLLLAAQLEPSSPRHSPGAAHHATRDPAPPSHERHGPVCFLCVLGPVLLAAPPLRLAGTSARRLRTAPEAGLPRESHALRIAAPEPRPTAPCTSRLTTRIPRQPTPT